MALNIIKTPKGPKQVNKHPNDRRKRHMHHVSSNVGKISKFRIKIKNHFERINVFS